MLCLGKQGGDYVNGVGGTDVTWLVERGEIDAAKFACKDPES